MEQNKQNTAKIVAMKMAERNRPVRYDGKRKGVLVILDGKPPVGDNTTLMLYTVKLRAVDEGKPAAYFSLAETNVQVVNRLIAIATGIDQEKITDGQLSESEWKLIDEKVPALMDAPLYVDDTADLTTDDLRYKLAGLATTKGVTFVVVDSVSRMADDAETVTDHLKAIAEALGITIVAIME